WIDPLPRGSAADPPPRNRSAKKSNLADWFYLPCWKPSLPLAVPAGQSVRHWLVFAAGEPAERLVERLRLDGNPVTAVRMGGAFADQGESNFTLNPAEPEEYRKLIEQLTRQSAHPEAVLHAWSLSSSDGAAANNCGEFETYQQTAFYSLLFLVQALISSGDQPLDLTVLTECAQALVPGEDLRPEAALLAGLCTVLPQEHPHFTCRCVELTPQEFAAESLPERLIAEAQAGSSGTIAYRASERFTPAYEPVRLEAQTGSAAFREDGVYLLLGGLEGNGLALAKSLARRSGLRLALVEDSASDSQLDAQVRSSRLDMLRQQGAEILPLQADIADPSQLRQAFSEVRQRFGALHGIIHAAGTQGVQTFGAIREMTPQDCLRHFRPKAHALYALRDALVDQDGLDFCILISSLASVLGGLAYGAYTAANRFMDAFALRRNRPGGLPWLSIDWDVWQLEDELEQITSLRRDLADLAMTPQEGEEVFERIVARGLTGQLVLSTADLSSRIADSRRRSDSQQGGERSAAQATLHSRPDLQNPYAPPENDLERDIAEVWQAVLGFESIGAHDNFFELGGDSFLAIQVASRLQDKLKIELPVARLYQGVTVRLLAELISQDAVKAEERAAHLQERRRSMSRRKDFLKKRRTARRQRSEVQ
ncbi:MAG: SDR family NAD(P)-dependent oxidoreductase, partial [Acidobacteriota bacterium]